MSKRCIVWECASWREGSGCGFLEAGTDCASPRWRKRFAEYKKAGIVTGGIFISPEYIKKCMGRKKAASAQIALLVAQIESQLRDCLEDM